jgi:phenylpropionate dioxygenase-like ring-hydroxylating dioxygenase large terminal subunit
MGVTRDASDYVRPGAVHRDIYKSSEIFDMEMDRIFKNTWVFVGHESEVTEPGDYRTLNIGREPVIYVRDENGSLAVLVNRCRHRGAAVCQMASGNARSFRCQYHGWTYRSDGRLLGVPRHDRYDEDLRDRLGLLALPRVESYRGLVFASFNESVPPLVDHLGPESLAYVDQWLDQCGGKPLFAAGESHQLQMDANWKFQMENGLDGYHGTFTHRSFFELMQHRTETNVRWSSSMPTAQAIALQHGNAVIDPRSQTRSPLVSRIVALPHADQLVSELRAEVGVGFEELLSAVPGPGINVGIFPNLQLVHINFRRIEPISFNQTLVTVTPLLLENGPDSFNELRLRYHELFYGPAGFGQPDDIEMFARVDKGLEDTEDDWLLLDRGLSQEDGQGNVRIGNVSDETPQRGQYREWTRLMTAPNRFGHTDV